jgi:hypothetical protein
VLADRQDIVVVVKVVVVSVAIVEVDNPRIVTKIVSESSAFLNNL